MDSLGCCVYRDVCGLAVSEEVIVDYFDPRDAGLGCGADFVVEDVAWILA